MTERSSWDVVVIGTGVAGLTTALSLGDRRVLVVTKSRLGEGGSTAWAQGGIAAPLGEGDSPELHARDTLAVGGGINEGRAVDRLTDDAAAAISLLIARGARLDRLEGGVLALGREAAHSRARILHAGGDATGAEVSRALVAAVRRSRTAEVLERTFAEDLVVRNSRVTGVWLRTAAGRRFEVSCGAVVLATGGIGQVYAHTTNPPEVTGDGLAMAARAGARLADLEFVQFHPTALAVGEDPLPLLTEAIRGDGAVLRDENGHRFMTEVHRLAELAPRDVVARAIWDRREAGGDVYLDARESTGDRFPERFPTVFAACRRHGIDPRVDAMPVTPAAHYHMGGVAVDVAGRTSLPGLWACGEAASTGVHGANRLASNSLLEGLVFGARIGREIIEDGVEVEASESVEASTVDAVPWAGQRLRAQIRSVMWRQVGLLRSDSGLAGAEHRLAELADRYRGGSGEERNLLLVARLVTAAARERRESRGAHARSDYPDQVSRWAHRSFVTLDSLLGPDHGEAVRPAARSEVSPS